MKKIAIHNAGMKKLAIMVLVATIGLGVLVAQADTMASPHYVIQSDSLNFGGLRSTSGSYAIEDTLGEVATGISSSTNYALSAGYQQMQVVGIAVVPASNVTMSPSIGGVTGGTANGSATFQVTTDDAAGYSATIQASSSPALVSGIYAFPNYIPAGASPDFAFNVGAATSTFAFSPKGSDTPTRYKDDGVNTCGTGSSNTAGACWDGLSTSPITIASRTSDNQPAGTATTLNFRAASGSSNIQPNGVYVATTTITVIAL